MFTNHRLPQFFDDLVARILDLAGSSGIGWLMMLHPVDLRYSLMANASAPSFFVVDSIFMRATRKSATDEDAFFSGEATAICAGMALEIMRLCDEE